MLVTCTDQYYRNIMALQLREALFDATIILNNGQQLLIIPRQLPSVLQTHLIIIFPLMSISIIIHLNITNITSNINNHTISWPMELFHHMGDFRKAYHSHSQLLHQRR